MDLSKINTLKLVHDDRFVRAKPDELAKLEYRFRDGVVMKPIVRKGQIVGFTATDRSGKRRPVIKLEITGSKHCYYCEVDEVKKQCRCVEVKCIT